MKFHICMMENLNVIWPSRNSWQSPYMPRQSGLLRENSEPIPSEALIHWTRPQVTTKRQIHSHKKLPNLSAKTMSSLRIIPNKIRCPMTLDFQTMLRKIFSPLQTTMNRWKMEEISSASFTLINWCRTWRPFEID